jgi:hypothetical protein
MIADDDDEINEAHLIEIDDVPVKSKGSYTYQCKDSDN